MDIQDGIVLENESKNEAVLLRQRRYELDEVRHALAKIAIGTYGICEASGEQILPKRLEAFPDARYRIKYQKNAEH